MTAVIPGGADAAPSEPLRLKYDRLTIVLHWTTVALVLAQFTTALFLDHLSPNDARLVLQAHRSTGVALWLVVAARLGWRFIGMEMPPFPPHMARWRKVGVHLSEYGLYTLLLFQPVTGLAETLLRGRVFALFGFEVPKLMVADRSLTVAARSLHILGAWSLAGAIGVHAGAALVHHLVLRDNTLKAMLPRRVRSRHYSQKS